MSKPITDVLRECHRLRRLLKTLQEEIDLGPRVQKIQQATLAKEEQAYKDSFETIKKLKLKQKDDEGALKLLEQQLDKLQTRSMEVTTMREMDATRSEISQANDKKGKIEEAILTTMTDLEERTTNIPNVEKKWADAQKEFAQLQIDAKERLERLRAEQAAAQDELAKADALIPAAAKATYSSLVKSHGPEGLAAVKDKVCRSCRSTLTVQKWIELQNGTFMTCSNCGRALYPEA